MSERGHIIFYKNGKYKRKYYQNINLIIENGYWKINRCCIMLKSKGNKWQSYKVNYYELTKVQLPPFARTNGKKVSYSIGIVLAKNKALVDGLEVLEYLFDSKE